MNRQNRDERRGVAIVIVLSLISITLALSYALLRSQSYATRTQTNSDLQGDARQAALAAYSIALQKIQDSSWAGADTTTSGSLGTNRTYQITYTTGDSSLTNASAKYSEYPYRLMIDVTGTATDPTNSAVSVSRKIHAVVKLVARQMSSEPTNLSAMLQYTYYQTGTDDCRISPRRRIEGAVRYQGQLRLCELAPDTTTSRSRYLDDLRRLWQASQPDNRPFSGTVSLSNTTTPLTTRNLMTSNLGLTLNNISTVSAGNDWAFPSSQTQYRLYTNGKVYNVVTVGSSLSSTSLLPDPLTNPAGLFVRSGDLVINSSVTIQGSLFCSGELNFRGASANLQPSSSLPTVQGSTLPTRLPVLVVGGDARIESGATGSITGLMAVFGNFRLDNRPQSQSFNLNGCLVSQSLELRTPNEWLGGSVDWTWLYNVFAAQMSFPSGTTYFPQFLAAIGMSSTPTTTLKPETTAVQYHWQRQNNPIFVKHDADPGLRWDVISFQELQ